MFPNYTLLSQELYVDFTQYHLLPGDLILNDLHESSYTAKKGLDHVTKLRSSEGLTLSLLLALKMWEAQDESS